MFNTRINFIDTNRDVFISSTTHDLKRYRETAFKTVIAANMKPIAMEFTGASPFSPLNYSIKLVQLAEIYIGIFAFRYGYIPDDAERNPLSLSMTELEYRAAREINIPILIFIAEKRISSVSKLKEDKTATEKLKKLKQELEREYTVSYFSSHAELGDKIYRSLNSTHLREYLAGQEDKPRKNLFIVDDKATTLDTRNEIAIPTLPTTLQHSPRPPQPYYVHRYIGKYNFIGRQSEIALLNEWYQSPDSLFVIEAMGGVGKSALAWEWMEARERDPISNIAGKIWWSFYEQNATMDNFISTALEYLTGKPKASFSDLTRSDRENTLLTLLQQKSYLIVLDGIERIMQGYEQKTETPNFGRFSYKTDESFFPRLVSSNPSKILITTRHIPKAIQTVPNQLFRRGRSIRLAGLNDEDVILFFREMGVEVEPERTQKNILNFTKKLGNHTLALGVIAPSIINYVPAPGNFDQWYKKEGKNLQLGKLKLEQYQHGILEHVLADLSPDLQQLLGHIATFSRSIDYDTLRDTEFYVTSNAEDNIAEDDAKLHAGLLELEDRGLLWWDRQNRLFNLHDLVRAVVLDRMEEAEQQSIIRRISSYLEKLPPEDITLVEKSADLKNSRELFDILIRAERWDDAIDNYTSRLRRPLLEKLADYNTIIEMLTPFFSKGFDQFPRGLTKFRSANLCITDLATAFAYIGEIAFAKQLRASKIKLALEENSIGALGVALRNYSSSLRLEENKLASAIHVCKLALELATADEDVESLGMCYFYLLQLYRDVGDWEQSEEVYANFQELVLPVSRSALDKWQSAVERAYAEILIQQEQDASLLLERAVRLANINNRANDFVELREISRLRGELALLGHQYESAISFFQESLRLARHSNLALSALMARLAYALVKAGEFQKGYDTMIEALNIKENGHVRDLYCSCAEIHLLLGNEEAAYNNALLAYDIAWAEGPPFAVFSQLKRVKTVLNKLGREEPNKPEYDRNNLEAIPHELEIQKIIKTLEYKKMGNKLYLTGDYANALEAFQVYVRRVPKPENKVFEIMKSIHGNTLI